MPTADSNAKTETIHMTGRSPTGIVQNPLSQLSRPLAWTAESGKSDKDREA